MRLVTIDNGNSNPHVGLFDGETLKEVIPLKDYKQDINDFILISSVGKPLDIKPGFDLKSKRSKTHFFDMKVHYAETLGDDRLIAGLYLYKNINANEKILLIDAGTFITCDTITAEGFMGGYILPGINRFLKAYSDSAQLPLLPKSGLHSLNDDLPQTTEEAITKALKIYLKMTIEEIIKKNAPDKIVFTGGTSADILSLLSLKVRSETAHHLIHSGMALIHQKYLAQA